MALSEVFNIAGSGMTAQSMRLNVIASNIANVSSAVASNQEPYKARRVIFTPIPVENEELNDRGDPIRVFQKGESINKVAVTAIVEDQSPPRLLYQPGHPLANKDGYVVMPNINPIEEMADMIAASRAYQTNVEVVNTTKTLLQSALRIGS